MQNTTNVILQTTSETVDNQTGEVVSRTTTTKVRLPKEPGFVKMYLGDLLHLRNIPTGLRDILDEMLNNMNYENLLVINAGMKRRMAALLGCSIHTINKALWKFSEAKILIRKDTGVYLFNPYLFGKGEWKNIHSIRSTIEWGENGKEIKTIFNKLNEMEDDA
jgi:hypothetical protein